MSEVSPELVERMVALVRGYVSATGATRFGPNGDRSVYAEACAIVEELPKPVDPDLVEARRIVTEVGAGGIPYVEGNDDWRPVIKIVLAAIKRGRELASQVPA